MNPRFTTQTFDQIIAMRKRWESIFLAYLNMDRDYYQLRQLLQEVRDNTEPTLKLIERDASLIKINSKDKTP
jgi:hypothetical protein